MANRSKEVKVVLIDTQYVVTNPKSFRSVVQSLTGKDSCVSWIEESSFVAPATRKKRKRSEIDDIEQGLVTGSGFEWKLEKGLSFKDLDRMIMEMPPLEDLYQFLSPSDLLTFT